jgi:preprotein translocase subunit SecY
MNKLKAIWQSKDLRKKILFTLIILVLYRMLAQISIPGVNLRSLKAIFDQNQALSVFSLLTGGSAENFSIVLMGLGPYINASIILQLLTVVVPKLEELSKEGESGQKKINSYTRWLTLPLALLQSYGMILLLNSQTQIPIIENINDPSVIIPIMLTVTAGTVLLMWMGELITESGIGNGISLLIFASIIAAVPTAVAQNLILATQDTSQLIPIVVLLLVTILLLIATVLVTEGKREIPVSYASKSQKGQMSSLPIRVNQAGMIPIIFAVSIVTFPSILGQLTANSTVGFLRWFSEFSARHLQFNSPLYLALLFILIIGFTFFYVSITFDPEKVAENIQKRGGYIPGIRPGKETAEYLGKVSTRLTTFGALFIAFIAVFPVLSQLAAGGTTTSLPLLISGAGILIIVGVVLDLLRQVNAELILHDYDKLY